MISSIRQERAHDDASADRSTAARTPSRCPAGARASTSSSRTTRASGSTSGWSRSGLWYVVTAVQATRGAFDEAYATALVTSGLFTPRSCGSCTGRPLGTHPGRARAGRVHRRWRGRAVRDRDHRQRRDHVDLQKVFGQAWATDWQAGLTAPFVEETSKGAIFLLLMGLAPVVIRTVSDGLIVGAYVGLGFQILEDVFYAQNAAFEQFGANQSEAVLAHLLRCAPSPASPRTRCTRRCSAPGLIYALGTPAQPRRARRAGWR